MNTVGFLSNFLQQQEHSLAWLAQALLNTRQEEGKSQIKSQIKMNLSKSLEIKM
jgi:hypothetical protein